MVAAAVLLSVVITQSVNGQRADQAPTNAAPAAALSSSDLSDLKTKATAGDADAQVKLGRAYQDGNGVPRNDDLAVKWYRASADQGNAIAQNDLGVMYRLGDGVDKDKEQAVSWYRKAARQKYAPAMFNLGAAYYNGDGVPINDGVASMWFLLAQECGSSAANDAVARMTQTSTPSELAEAYFSVGDMYKNGLEIPQDYSRAADWYRKAADAGSAYANMQLAQQLVAGQGVAQDYGEARRRCESAAKAQYYMGDYCLGVMNRQGLGGPKDPAEAAKWFARAAEMRHTESMLLLGEMYWKGEGVKQDKETAYMWIWIAAKAGVKGAAQDQQQLEAELDPKEIQKVQKKAALWAQQHKGAPFYPLKH
ncbi:MAG TPA: SEL1-like repeat protein [Terriglobales bacterium]